MGCTSTRQNLWCLKLLCDVMSSSKFTRSYNARTLQLIDYGISSTVPGAKWRDNITGTLSVQTYPTLATSRTFCCYLFLMFLLITGWKWMTGSFVCLIRMSEVGVASASAQEFLFHNSSTRHKSFMSAVLCWAGELQSLSRLAVVVYVGNKYISQCFSRVCRCHQHSKYPSLHPHYKRTPFVFFIEDLASDE